MEKVSLTINGVRVEAESGTTVLQAAREAEIYIPTLCSRPDLSLSLGSCRLCVVEVEGGESRFPTSCMTPVAEGLKVLHEYTIGSRNTASQPSRCPRSFTFPRLTDRIKKARRLLE